MNKLNLKINFDICTFCNHACTFCSNSDKRTIKDMTSLEDFEKVMDNVMRYINANELGLSAKGEPLLNKSISKMIILAKKKYGIPYVYISSNGVLCDEDKSKELLAAGLDSVKFSINATDRKTYREVHKKDDFDSVIKNLKFLIKCKKEYYSQVKIFISSVVQHKSKKELEEKFKEIFKDDYGYIDNVWCYPLSFTAKDNVETGKQIKLPKCKVPFKEIWINSDSTLGLCCKDYFDEINFGSLLEDDFLSIYESKKFDDIRNMHKKSFFKDEGKLCEKCLMYGL